MTRPKNPSRYPVSSFGPELMAVLIKGSKEEVRIPCRDMKFARALQQRIHMLRGAMAREKHPQYQTVTRARTSRDWKEKPVEGSRRPEQFDIFLVIRPQDSQFAEALKASGVEVTPADGDLLLESALPPEPSNDPMTVEESLDQQPTTPDANIYERFK